MDSIHNLDDFLGNSGHFSIPLCDKESLKKITILEKIISQIDDIYPVVENTNNHVYIQIISRNNRNTICKIIVLYSLITHNLCLNKYKDIITILREPISKHLSNNTKMDICDILENLKSILMEVVQKDAISKIGIRRIGKLDLEERTAFDSFMMSDKLGLKQEVHDYLKNNRVWYVQVNYPGQTINIKGELSEDELLKKISNYNRDVFKYIQEDRKHITLDYLTSFSEQ